MQGIKFCQYCGEKERLEINQYNDKYAVHCQHCGSIGPMGKDEEFAILKWNDRILEVPEMPEMPQEFPNSSPIPPDDFYMCPLLAINKNIDNEAENISCQQGNCAMWIWEQTGPNGDSDKGHCGLVNIVHINSKGGGA